MKTIIKLSLNSIKNSKTSSFAIGCIFFTINFILIFLSLDFIGLYSKVIRFNFNNIDKYDQAMIAISAVYLLILLLSCLTLRTISALRVLNIKLKISQFKALGATNNQLYLFVFFVYTILFICTLPFIFIFFLILLFYTKLYNPQRILSLFLIIKVILFSSFISFIIINLSVIKAYNIIKKITPLGLTKEKYDKNINKKDFQSYEKLNIYSIAKANTFRDKEYMIKTIITMSFSGIIFITTSIIINNIKFEFLNKDIHSEILHIRLSYILNIACSFIGLINYINIVINNVIKNKEKFGIYKAIGIKNKDIIKIQLMETFYYSICATFFSLIIGNALGYFLFILQKNNIYFVIFYSLLNDYYLFL